jgi:hypothetical protein
LFPEIASRFSVQSLSNGSCRAKSYRINHQNSNQLEENY